MRTVLAALLVLATAVSAQAEPAPVQVIPHQQATANCGPANSVLAVLKAKFGETPAWIGATDGDSTVVLTRSADGGTWTMLAIGVGAGGEAVACELAEGMAADMKAPTQ